jgi:hypothetical protein
VSRAGERRQGIRPDEILTGSASTAVRRLAESTFGRLAVNDGKLLARLAPAGA